MESKGAHEFLLGVEEYLSNLGCKDPAVKIHNLAIALSHSQPKVEITKMFFQQCSQYLTSKDNIPLSDLVHKFNKAVDNVDFKDALLIYLMHQKESISIHSADLIHKILKLNSEEAIKDALSMYLMNQHINDQSLKNFIFKETKNTAVNDHHKSLLQYLSVALEDKDLVHLCHQLYKSDNDQDFVFNFIKSAISSLEVEFPTDKFFRGINSCIKHNHLPQEVINDAFSRSQIKSKFWLVKELAKIQKSYGNVLLLAGWFGQTKSIYEKFLTYQKMRIADLDKQSCEISDYVFNLSNLENHKVKSIVADINNLTLHKNGYEWLVENFKEPEKNYNEKFLPDLIINTSAEHMTEDWFHQIRFKKLDSNPIVAIQSNNMFDIEEHVNCVHSVEHMKKKFPMREVLYEGELQLKGYKRVMLIGRP
jgi:hypothetical protein